MKRLALLFALVCAVGGTVAVANALAGSPSPVAQATGFTCTVLDANGNFFQTTQSSDTLYQSGKEQEHCVGTGAGNGTVVYWDFSNTGLSCNLFFDGSTTNWFDRVSKSGESQLTCFSDGFTAPSSSAGVGATG